jgi:hypothetical protein
MTDLQLGLMVIGALAVAGVLIYNRFQERSSRRAAERAFGSRHADVLLGEAAGRQEPAFANAVSSGPPAAIEDAMPDERADYVIELGFQQPTTGHAVMEFWAPIDRRFGKRALLAASDGHGWRRLRSADAGSCVTLRAAFQLVSRAGVVSDAEVLEFRSAIEDAAGKLKAAIRSAPEMRESLDSARELDRVCVEADIQVALHVLGVFDDEQAGQWRDQPFQVARRSDGLTFTLDVPRTPDIIRGYEAMARAARHLASATQGRLVDDHGKTLDDAALAAIGAQLEPARRALSERGIEPGEPLALRIFS